MITSSHLRTITQCVIPIKCYGFILQTVTNHQYACQFWKRSQFLQTPKNRGSSVGSRNEMVSNRHCQIVWTVFTPSYPTPPFQRRHFVVYNETSISALALIPRWMFRLFNNGLRKCNRFFDLASSEHHDLGSGSLPLFLLFNFLMTGRFFSVFFVVIIQQRLHI